MTDHCKPCSAPEPRGQNDRQVILLTGSSGLIRDLPLTCSSSATPTAAHDSDQPLAACHRRVYTLCLEVLGFRTPLLYGVNVKSWLVASPPEISTGARDDFVAYPVAETWTVYCPATDAGC